MKSIFCLFFSLFLITSARSQDDVSNLSVILHSTFHHISVHVDFDGDLNLNSDCVIEYKATNESAFRMTALVMRAHPTMQVDWSDLNRNHYAASAMFLEPNTSYDIKITIDDPENSTSIVQEATIFTKAFPVPPQDSNIKYVIPGNGGGQGTELDPYLGLQTAADNAIPGDVILAKPGVYSEFVILNNGNSGMPITFKSEQLHQAIIDGDNTNKGVVTVGNYDVSVHNHIIDGFVIRNGYWGIDAQNTSFLTIQNNKIEDVGFGFLNRRENNFESDQYITNNVFLGRTSWPQLNGEIPAERAIDIRGNNNVVSFNTISNFADAVSTDGPPYQTSYSLDIYNNEMTNVVDDFIEIDGTISNSRVYNNRGFNGRMGISVAPVFGGPAYVFRNVFYNMELSLFKMNRGPAGLVLVHNLGVKTGNGTSSDAGWQNTVLKNNVIMGTRYCFEEYGQIDENTEDWDYNAYFSTRAAIVNEEWFKWQNIRYATIQDLAGSTSIESHGVAASLSDIENVSMPDSYGVVYSIVDQDFQLSSNSKLKNIGIDLDNLNLPYVTDGFPDIGPYEYGSELPQYGADFESMTSTSTLFVQDFMIFPNPTNGRLKIATQDNVKSVCIYSVNGELMKTILILDKSIDVSDLSDGVYWVELKGEKAFFKRKKIVLISK